MSSTTSGTVLSSGDRHDRILKCCLFDGWLRTEIGAVLTQTQRWNIRNRELPADLVLGLVLAMGAARRLSVPSLLTHAAHHLHKPGPRWVTEEAFYHARRRLGFEPVLALFDRIAGEVCPSASLFGLRPWALDGTTLTVPDTKENAACFGRPTAPRGETAFPVLSLITLVDTTTRRIRDAVIGPYKDPEREACVQLAAHLCENDVLFIDAGITAAWLLDYLRAAGIHFIARASTSFRPRVVKELGPGDALVEIDVFEPIPRPDGDDRRPNRRFTRKLQLRMLSYRLPDRPPVRLFTDLTDCVRYSSLEIVRGYHQRWESELVTDEIKTHQLAPAKGTLPTCLRSKTPGGVLQELYGVLTVYNIIRTLIDVAASVACLDPLEISFVHAVQTIALALPAFRTASPAERSTLAARLLRAIAACRLRRPRRPRQCPRVVRRRSTHYPTKTRSHREQRLPIISAAAMGVDTVATP